MRTSSKGLNIIKKAEGLSLEAYLDPVGIWTIGYGHANNGRGVNPGMVITKQEAENLLRQDVKTAEDSVKRLITAPLSQSQFDALVSFTFNLGSGSLQRSTLRKKVNQNPNDPSIAAEFKRWVMGDGQTLPGLVKRRAKEAALYFSDSKKKVVLMIVVVLIVVGLLVFKFKKV